MEVLLEFRLGQHDAGKHIVKIDGVGHGELPCEIPERLQVLLFGSGQAFPLEYLAAFGEGPVAVGRTIQRHLEINGTGYPARLLPEHPTREGQYSRVCRRPWLIDNHQAIYPGGEGDDPGMGSTQLGPDRADPLQEQHVAGNHGEVDGTIQ